MSNVENEHCKTAAQMLSSEPGLLDYRLVEYLNNIARYALIAGSGLYSKQAIATAIVTWQEWHADDFTKHTQ